MAALLVLNYDVHDPATLAEYRDEAAPVILGGTAWLVTTTGQTHHLSEVDPGGTHTVVLSYRSVVEARRRYESEEYQALLGKRLAATTPRAAFIVEVTNPYALADLDPKRRRGA